MTVLDVAAAGLAGRDPDGLALVSPSGSLTRRALDRAVSARAEALASAGAGSGRVLPVVLETDLDGIVTLLAAWRAGAVPAPLNPRLTAPERAVATGALTEAPEGTQVVLWTSGTSGSPRGVALGRAGLEAHVRAVAERLRLDGTEAWLASLSVAHVGGLALVARAVMTGAVLIVPGRSDADTMHASFAGEPDPAVPRVTHASLVPTQLDRLIEGWGDAPPPPSLRCILVGGARAPGDLLDRALERGWPIALTYGMTEMWSQVATAPPALVRSHPGSVGPPLEGVEVAVDPEGEILVRGPTQALGYVGGEGEAWTDGEGWYRTGDIGLVDERGDLRITGRRSDRIISGGVNVDPSEVEDVLRAHPAVRDAVVLGVPSREWGETVAAVVVPVWGTFELAEVETFLRDRLSGPKRPRMWKIEATLPRNANGKIDRAAAKALFALE